LPVFGGIAGGLLFVDTNLVGSGHTIRVVDLGDNSYRDWVYPDTVWYQNIIANNSMIYLGFTKWNPDLTFADYIYNYTLGTKIDLTQKFGSDFEEGTMSIYFNKWFQVSSENCILITGKKAGTDIDIFRYYQIVSLDTLDLRLIHEETANSKTRSVGAIIIDNYAYVMMSNSFGKKLFKYRLSDGELIGTKYLYFPDTDVEYNNGYIWFLSIPEYYRLNIETLELEEFTVQ